MQIAMTQGIVQTIPFEDVAPEARVAWVLRKKVQYVNLADVLQHFMGAKGEHHAQMWCQKLETNETLKPYLSWFGLRDEYCCFYGITIPGLLKFFKLHQKKWPVSEAVVQKFCDVYKGDRRDLGPEHAVGEVPGAPAILDDAGTRKADAPVHNRVLEPAVVIGRDEKVVVVPIDGVEGGRLRVVVKGERRYVSTRDIIRSLCEKNNRQAAQAWMRLSPEAKEELKPYLGLFTFAGSGEVEQPVIEVYGALRMIMLLEDGRAERNREALLAALAQVWNGDAREVRELAERLRGLIEWKLGLLKGLLAAPDGEEAKRARLA